MINSQELSFNKLLSSLAEAVWKDDGLTGDPITPTLTDIQEMAIVTPETEKDVTVASNGHSYRVIVTHPPEVNSGQREWHHKEQALQELQAFRKHFPNTQDASVTEIRTNEAGTVSPSEYFTVAFIDRNDIGKFLSFISRHIIRTAGEPSPRRRSRGRRPLGRLATCGSRR